MHYREQITLLTVLMIMTRRLEEALKQDSFQDALQFVLHIPLFEYLGSAAMVPSAVDVRTDTCEASCVSSTILQVLQNSPLRGKLISNVSLNLLKGNDFTSLK